MTIQINSKKNISKQIKAIEKKLIEKKQFDISKVLGAVKSFSKIDAVQFQKELRNEW